MEKPLGFWTFNQDSKRQTCNPFHRVPGLVHGPDVPGGQGLLSKWPPLFEGKATIGMFYGDTVTAFFDA